MIDRYLGEAAAAHDTEDADDAAMEALSLVTSALEMSPRAEATLELRARALLTLRRYRDVADMLRDYISRCAKSCSGDGATTTTSSGFGAELLSSNRDRFDAGATRFLCCLDVSDLERCLIASS